MTQARRGLSIPEVARAGLERAPLRSRAPWRPGAGSTSTASPQRWWALAVLCVPLLIVSLDNTVLNVVLPTLVRKLHATTSELQWIVDAYALVFGGLMLVAGSLADRVGRKRTFVAGLLAFAAGSTWAAFSGSVGLLIAARASMGIGAALIMPSTLSIITNTFTDRVERQRALGFWSATSGAGVALGPIVGGLLLAHFCWGSLLSIVGLGLVLWAIIEAPVHGWSSGLVLGAGACGLAVLAGFLAWELSSSHPMLDLRFFLARRFSAAVVCNGLLAFGLYGSLFVLTQFLQFQLGYSPLQAGLRVLPAAGAIAVAAPLSSVLVRRAGAKLTVAAGLLVAAAGLWQVSGATVATTYGGAVAGMVMIGVGAGLVIPSATGSVMGSLPSAHTGVGSATNGSFMQVGGALGVAVVGSLLSTRYQHRISDTLAPFHVPQAVEQTIRGSLGGALGVAEEIGGATGQLLTRFAHAAFINAMDLGLIAAAIVALAGAMFALLTLPSQPSLENDAPAAAPPTDGAAPT